MQIVSHINYLITQWTLTHNVIKRDLSPKLPVFELSVNSDTSYFLLLLTLNVACWGKG